MGWKVRASKGAVSVSPEAPSMAPETRMLGLAEPVRSLTITTPGPDQGAPSVIVTPTALTA